MIEYVKKSRFAALPLIIMSACGLLVWLWPMSGPDERELARIVRPPVAEAGPNPQTILSVAQGQPVGDEAYFKRFRLNTGWHLAPDGDRYTLVADVTNVSDTPDTANVLVRIRVADRYVELLICQVDLSPDQTGALACARVAQAPYSSRWSRIILETF